MRFLMKYTAFSTLSTFCSFMAIHKSQNIRYYFHNNFSFMLEVYYQFIKTVADKDDNIRKADYATWGIQSHRR
uniref:Uncharacterized protein n=1 Tax=Tetranychus urticae TaxID=32264 RepID=T1KHI5_TETUR